MRPTAVNFPQDSASFWNKNKRSVGIKGDNSPQIFNENIELDKNVAHKASFYNKVENYSVLFSLKWIIKSG